MININKDKTFQWKSPWNLPQYLLNSVWKIVFRDRDPVIENSILEKLWVWKFQCTKLKVFFLKCYLNNNTNYHTRRAILIFHTFVKNLSQNFVSENNAFAESHDRDYIMCILNISDEPRFLKILPNFLLPKHDFSVVFSKFSC